MERPDVLVIGTGTAGQTAAYDLVEEGYRVAIAEKSDNPGGVCALAGCQAKKWFYELTETIARCNHLQGIGIVQPPEYSWQQVLQAKNNFTDKVPENTVAGLRSAGIDYLEGAAKFLDETTIEVNGVRYSPRYTIIAAGARPSRLPIEGSEYLITSREFLELQSLPESIVFVGGGFISFEFAHFAARLGARPGHIHIVERGDRPLAPFDTDMVEFLARASQEEGIEIHTGSSVESITRTENGYTVTLDSGISLHSQLVVHGAGREPDLDDLDLEKAGIDYSPKGIKVDEHMATTNPNVLAVGDSAATIQLARVADFEAHAAAGSVIAFDHGDTPPFVDYDSVPATLFTYPQLGMVGKTEDQLKSEGQKYWKSVDSKVGWPTYRRIGLKHAAYKILVDDKGIILGAHILSDNATGLINTMKQAMRDRTPVGRIHQDHIMSPYPSRESDLIYMLSPLLD